MGERILVADDDEELLTLIVDTLRREGFEVQGVADTAAMRSAIAQQSFALVVTDVHMPGGSGLSFVEELRKAGNETPVVLMTAFSNDHTRNQAKLMGAFLFDKPFDFQYLKDVAKQLVRE